jgi:hypothetical protein
LAEHAPPVGLSLLEEVAEHICDLIGALILFDKAVAVLIFNLDQLLIRDQGRVLNRSGFGSVGVRA